jgi:hypothetical protein
MKKLTSAGMKLFEEVVFIMGNFGYRSIFGLEQYSPFHNNDKFPSIGSGESLIHASSSFQGFNLHSSFASIGFCGERLTVRRSAFHEDSTNLGSPLA